MASNRTYKNNNSANNKWLQIEHIRIIIVQITNHYMYLIYKIVNVSKRIKDLESNPKKSDE